MDSAAAGPVRRGGNGHAAATGEGGDGSRGKGRNSAIGQGVGCDFRRLRAVAAERYLGLTVELPVGVWHFLGPVWHFLWHFTGPSVALFATCAIRESV
jgi:hypothetical protein